MLKVKRLMCLSSCLIFFNIFDMSTVTPFHSLATEVVEDKNIAAVPKNKIGLIKKPIEVEVERIKQEELERQREQEIENEKKKMNLNGKSLYSRFIHHLNQKIVVLVQSLVKTNRYHVAALLTM